MAGSAFLPISHLRSHFATSSCWSMGASRPAASPEQLANRRHQFGRHDHDGLSLGFIGGLVLGDGFLLGLVLVVIQDLADALFIPALWELLPNRGSFLWVWCVLFHRRFLRCRRR